jgi:hypothetical protein
VWSSGRRSAACTSSSGSRSRRSSAARAATERRSAVRFAPVSRPAIGVRRDRRSLTVPRRDRSAAGLRSAPARQADPGADRGARLLGLEDDPRRLPARAAPALSASAHVSADGLSARRAAAVRPVRAARADPGRPGQMRRGWVVTAELCWSRALAGALVFSKQAPDLVFGKSRGGRRAPGERQRRNRVHARTTRVATRRAMRHGTRVAPTV